MKNKFAALAVLLLIGSTVAEAAPKVECQTVGAFRRYLMKKIEFSAAQVASSTLPVQVRVSSLFGNVLQSEVALGVPAQFESGDSEASGNLRYDVTGGPAQGDSTSFFLIVPQGDFTAVAHFDGFIDLLFAGGANGWVRMPIACKRLF
jgi:hypothetical protein